MFFPSLPEAEKQNVYLIFLHTYFSAPVMSGYHVWNCLSLKKRSDFAYLQGQE
jgi:hypothetical protein